MDEVNNWLNYFQCVPGRTASSSAIFSPPHMLTNHSMRLVLMSDYHFWKLQKLLVVAPSMSGERIQTFRWLELHQTSCLQHIFPLYCAFKVKKCFVVYKAAPDIPSTQEWADNDNIFIFGRTYPFTLQETGLEKRQRLCAVLCGSEENNPADLALH